jgi:hypothetical protein
LRKKIYLLLDILLILGAMLAILTIGGGRWMLNSFTFHQGTGGVMDTSITVDTSGSPGEVSNQENSNQAERPCASMAINGATPIETIPMLIAYCRSGDVPSNSTTMVGPP